MKSISKLKNLGYIVEKWSSWKGDKGKYRFCKGNGHWVGMINLNDNTINPCHGFYGGYLKNVAKEIGFTLNEY